MKSWESRYTNDIKTMQGATDNRPATPQPPAGYGRQPLGVTPIMNNINAFPFPGFHPGLPSTAPAGLVRVGETAAGPNINPAGPATAGHPPSMERATVEARPVPHPTSSSLP